MTEDRPFATTRHNLALILQIQPASDAVGEARPCWFAVPLAGLEAVRPPALKSVTSRRFPAGNSTDSPKHRNARPMRFPRLRSRSTRSAQVGGHDC